MNPSATLETSPSPTILPQSSSGVAANVLVTVGIVMLLASAVGAFHDPEQTAYSWLFAFLFFFTLAVGSLFWSVIHHALHSAWTTVFRRLWENVAATLPILAFLFLPILFCGPTIYRWMRSDTYLNDPLLREKSGYLNMAFWDGRAILFFTIFISIALFYRRHSVEQDEDASPVHSATLQARSYVLLALYGLAFTFMSFDWIMSLDYHWASTMFGVTIFAGAAASSVALIIVIAMTLRRMGYLPIAGVEHDHLLGKLLFSFVTFWGWVCFGQYLLIWYANIPEETIFFINRCRGSWEVVGVAMILFNFVFPFLVLLLQATKRSRFWLTLMALSVLLGHALEIYWLVMPTIHPEGVSISYLDVVTWLGMACVLASFFIRRSSTAAIYPIKDPRLPEALEAYN